MRFAAVLLLLAAAPAQEKSYECKLKKMDVKGGGSHWYLDFTLEHNFPERSLFGVRVRMLKHQYIWRTSEFAFEPEASTPMPLYVQASGKTARPTDPLSVTSAGLYEFSFAFDPQMQRVDSVRKSMGRKWVNYEFPVVIVTVGDPKKFFLALQDDTEDCARMIKNCTSTMERIERESDDPDFEKKQPSILAAIQKEQTECEKKIAFSLHAGTYKVIGQILTELTQVCQQIKMMKAMSKVGGNGGTGGGELETEHQGPSDEPILPALDGKAMSLDRMKSHIGFCDDIRIREYFSWITILHLQALDRIDEAKKENANLQKAKGEVTTVNEELEKAFKHMLSSKSEEKFVLTSTYLIEDKEQKYADFFVLFRDYVQALTADAPDLLEQQKKIRDHITAARDRAIGKRKKK